MASLVLGAVGAYFGGPVGWAIGSAIGGAIDNSRKSGQHYEGQRLRDLHVQDSAYGNFISVVYGDMRLAGNVIWALDFQAVEHTTSTSSKGGGGGSSSTTYSYNATFAVGICAGPIAGVRRVWADGKLLYDATATSTTLGAFPMTIYLGSETQLADPTISAHEGAANTPGYRGLAYVVIKNFNVSPYGNRLPNLSFEVVQSASPADSARLVKDYNGLTYTLKVIQGGLKHAPNGTLYGIYTVGSGSILPAGTYVAQVDTTDGTMISARLVKDNAVIMGFTADGRAWMYNAFDYAVPPFTLLSLATPGAWAHSAIGNFYSTNTIQFIAGSPAIIGNDMWYINRIVDSPNAYFLQRVSAGGTGQQGVSGEILFDPSEILKAVATDGTHLYALGVTNIYKFNPDDPSDTVSVPGNDSNVGSGNTTRSDILYENGKVWVIYGNRLTVYNPSDLSVFSTTPGFGSAGLMWNFIRFEDNTVGLSNTGNNAAMVQFDTSGNLLSTSYIPACFGGRGIWSQNPLTNEVYSHGYEFGLYQLYSGRLASSAPTVGSVVANLMNQVGYSASDYDVSALTMTLDGFILTTQSPARTWIEQLAYAYFFDTTEHGGKLVFVPRGSNPVATIVDNDLAAHDPAQQLPVLLQVDRMQETELSESMSVTYLNINQSYQSTTQLAKRLVTKSKNQSTTGLALALDDNHARQIADIRLFNEHTERVSYQFQCGPAYFIYESTDVIMIDNKVMRLSKDTSDGDLTIKFDAVAEDPSIYTNSTTGSGTNFTQQAVANLIPTNLLYLDVPQLRDQDLDPGFYIAAYGSVTWPGAVIYRSADGGASYANAGSIFPPTATVGYTTTALGNWVGPNIPDESNSITVSLYFGALSSVTMAQLLQGQNYAFVGGELINFRTATLNVDNTYTLTGLLRGRVGTEVAQSTHAIGESFVLLSATSISDLVESASLLNTPQIYKAATIGSNISVTPIQSFTNTGVRVRPLYPVGLKVGRNAALDCVIAWTRRARYGAIWRDYVDAAIGETIESYDIEIYSNSSYTTVVRTAFGVTSPTVTYTAAQQIIDFGSTQSTIYFKVYQNSSVIGRGYAATSQG